ncbi:MAG: BTAD domain-containing putative transcriptional regulator, partial [Candidatus Promineifilaceae bacterium]|nr:BTAD domain-containing putative transcriptional regulator [Candidatus Promineifilaceae bacterium]
YLVTEDAFAEKARPPAHSRDHLMALLWPRTSQNSAQVNLRQTLYQLRQAIPEVAGPDGGLEPFLLSDRQTVQVNPDAAYRLDVARFLRLQAEDPSPDELAEAVSLYRGPFLSDFHLPDSESFEEWATARRATLQRTALEAMETLTGHYLRRAEPAEAERYARRQLALDELRESGHRQLMRALTQQGKRNAALTHYDDYCALLAEELGVQPSAEIEAVYEAVSEGQAAEASVPGAQAEPEMGKKQPRLPSPATPFVGRRQEMAQVNGMLEDGCRLLTLLGPGGSGKTRLALEIARRRAGEYTHGAAFVDLAPLSDPADIPTTIAVAISMALDFRFTTEGSPREQILNHLADKELLLVLDNVEHLLDKHLLDPHLPAGVEMVGDLLQTAPGLCLMATSRARLNLGSECLFEVGGLKLPEDGPRAEGEPEAVEMFMEYARRVQPAFSVSEEEGDAVAHICRLVEGMPLAIELAASWVRYLSPLDIARELSEDLDFLESERVDLPERQRSMRAAFDHSWKLLDEEGRQALMKLSVFRGGASRRAAKAVTGVSLRTLTGLADHSLLTRDPDSGRFAVHELIRQFAVEKLALNQDSLVDVRNRQMDYFLDLVEKCDDAYRRTGQVEWLDELSAEHDNITAALQWALEQEEIEKVGRLSSALGVFWGIRGHLDRGRQWLEKVLVRRGEVSNRTLGKVYFALGWIAFERSDYAAAEDYYRRSYDLLNELGTTLLLADVLSCLGHAAQQQANYDRAATFCERSLSLYRQLDDTFGIARNLNRLGRIAELQGNLERAVTLLRESLELRQATGDERGTAASLNALAEIARYRKEYERAASLYEETLEICTRLADKRCIAGVQHNLAHVALQLENVARSAALFRESLNLYRELANTEGIALCLAGLGGVLCAQGAVYSAVRLLSKSDALFESNQVILGAADQLAYDDFVAGARAQLDDENFDMAWSSGENLSLDEAIQIVDG